MNIRKLPSGNYQIRQKENGREYSVTVPYKPTKKEAYQIIQDHITVPKEDEQPFNEAAQKYIASKNNVLSPSTIKGYWSVFRSLPDWFTALKVSDITNYQMQKLTNEISKDHSPKTVRNVYGFCAAVIRLFYPSADISATMPQKVRKEKYVPSTDEVKRLFEYASNSEYYVALRLASMSLRRSEICALELSDLDGNILTINKAYVEGPDGYVIKPTPKTDASNRTVIIPAELADRIRKQGYIYRLYPNSIDNYLRRSLKHLGIPSFGIHSLRHFFASYSHELGYSDAQIQAAGGWTTDYTMKKIYRHAMNQDEARKKLADDFNF